MPSTWTEIELEGSIQRAGPRYICICEQSTNIYGDTNPCRMTGVTLHGAVSPELQPPSLTSGLLLLTTDGQLADALTDPGHNISKTYHAWELRLRVS